MVSLTARSRLSTIIPVRRILLRWAVLITLAAMLGGHMTELFDHWENTLQTGSDVDYTVVILAACAGVVFVAPPRIWLSSSARHQNMRIRRRNSHFHYFRQSFQIYPSQDPLLHLFCRFEFNRLCSTVSQVS